MSSALLPHASLIIRLLGLDRCAILTEDLIKLVESSEYPPFYQISNWINFAHSYLINPKMWGFEELNQSLCHATYLLGSEITLADVAVWITLHVSVDFKKLLSDPDVDLLVNLRRYYRHLLSVPSFAALASKLPRPDSVPVSKPTKREHDEHKCNFEEGGKFEALPGAVQGQVVVRFPPEAGGYLHVGHGKAALMNQHYKDMYNGKLILRFDDTNPEKEKIAFEEAIKLDLERMQVKWDQESHTSDHFDTMLAYCEQLIRSGQGYVDNTDNDTMRTERSNRQESKCRNNSVETNLKWWAEMKSGSEFGQTACVRAKIDMLADNGAMRDPAIYRCKSEPHAHTGTKYKVYPTYDFACPIVDSIEGVTHALRTSEYNDRNDQFAWFCKALGIRCPAVVDYSRVALQNTVLSKRKLVWFVDDAHLVDSWSDPRMPTVSGLFRRGLQSSALKQFMLAQGSSRNPVQMEWDKLWAFNKKIIDPTAPRYTGLLLSAVAGQSNTGQPMGLVPIDVKGQAGFEEKTVALHPKDASLGQRTILVGPRVWVEHADAVAFQPDTNVTFINWGNLKIVNIVKRDTASGVVIDRIEAELNVSDMNFKKTLKVTWLAGYDSVPAAFKPTPLSVLIYDHLLTKSVIEKDDDFKQFVNKNSKLEQSLIGDAELATLKQGDIIQLQRRGYYICDRPYEAKCKATGHESPCVLIQIPEGSVKTMGAAAAGDDQTAKSGGGGGSSSSAKSTKPALDTSNMTPEEAAKAEERLRAKEDKKNARKAARAKHAKTDGGDQAEPSQEAPVKAEQQPPASSAPVPKKPVAAKSVKPKEAINGGAGQPKPAASGGQQIKKRTKVGLEVTKETDVAEWYSQLVVKAELLDYYTVSGCYIIRPWAYSIWQALQTFLDGKFQELGVENAYFPMFVTKAALECEKTHVTDFAPEVAWVTKSGSTDLAEPLAIRPTSETVMYPAFARWIQSHRDLPLKLNQWSNIVRWEFKHPQPFLRTREFLWQEGHTAFADKADADAEVLQILGIYAEAYEKLLAVPVVRGVKTEKEKFAGADYTTTCEVFIGSTGRAIQGATSHHLGQNFSKMFNVVYDSPTTGLPTHVYQNSWGFTTRSLGILFMIHGDNQGLVLPPRIAPIQMVVIPCGITAKSSDADRDRIMQAASQLASKLSQAGFRVKCDDRENVSPGWKFNHWELKGVPIRLEMGPNEVANEACCAVFRHNGEKLQLKVAELLAKLPGLLDSIHNELFTRARTDLLQHLKPCWQMPDLFAALDAKSLAIGPFCGSKACEENVKKESARNAVVEPGAPSMGAKSLCSPFKCPFNPDFQGEYKPTADMKCFNYDFCKCNGVRYTMFGRSY